MGLPTYDEAHAFRNRLKYLVQNDPCAQRLASIIRQNMLRDSGSDDCIEDLFWAFCHPKSRALLELLSTSADPGEPRPKDNSGSGTKDDV